MFCVGSLISGFVLGWICFRKVDVWWPSDDGDCRCYELPCGMGRGGQG